MRKITTLLAMLLCSFAYSQETSLTLSLQDSSVFTAVLNGKTYADPSNVMNFHELRAGDQQLKVIKLLKTGSSIVEQPVFEGVINLPIGRATSAYIDKYNQFRVSGSQNQASSDGNNSSSAGSPDFVPNPQLINAYTQPTTNSVGMNDQQFAGQIELLKSMNTDQGRFQSAKGLVSLGTFNSNQIAEMMLTMDAEKHRVNLADYAYAFVTDKTNYGVVFNALRYPSSVNRLNRRLY